MGDLSGPYRCRLLGYSPDIQGLDIMLHNKIVHFLRQPVIPFISWYKRSKLRSLYKIKSCQVVEVEHMVPNHMGCMQDVTHLPAIFIICYPERHLQVLVAADRVDARTDAADPCRDVLCLFWISADHDLFKATVKHCLGLGLDNLAFIYLYFYPQVAFYSCYRINF